MAEPKTLRTKVLAALDVERFYTEVEGLELVDGGEQWMARCPFHSDSTPSFAIRKTDGVYNCFGCGAKGSVFDYHAKQHSQSFAEAFSVVAEFAGVEVEETEAAVELPGAAEVERWQRNLFKNGPRHRVLNEQRGLNDETLREYGIGWDGDRYTIPIYDADGALVNVRRYLPNAKPAHFKTVGLKGHNGRRLYPLAALKGDLILLTEGELDALICRQFAFNALTGTGGALNWLPTWNELFRGKDVIIAYDNDREGAKGTDKVGKFLLTVAKSVKRIVWPEGFKKDATDYFVAYKKTAADFAELLDAAIDFVPGVEVETPDGLVGGFALSDLGNAERMVKMYGENLRYVDAWNKFIVWDDDCPKWKVDDVKTTVKRAFAVVRGMKEEVKSLDGKDQDLLTKWALISESERKLSAMVTLTKAKVSLHPEKLNRDPLLLNTPSGVVRLDS